MVKEVKILHMIPSFGLGGMEKVIATLINYLPHEYHHDILVLDNNISASKWIKAKNIQFVEFHKPHGRVAFWKSLYNTMLPLRDRILMTYNWGSTDGIWIGRLLNISPIYHSEHGFNVDEAGSTNWKRDLVRKLVYPLASKVIVVSQELRKLMVWKYSLNENHVRIIPNGIDVDVYSPAPDERKFLRAHLGLKESDFVVGFCGRMDPVKNIDLLLEVFKQCRKSDVDFKLVMVGEGSEREKIEKFIKVNGFTRDILLVGQQEQVLPYLRTFDAFLLTSHREQMPMSMLEAMAVGIPVVSTPVGEIPYIIRSGYEGFLSANGNCPIELADHLKRIKNSKNRGAMNTAARNSVLEKFQEKRMVEAYRQLLGS